MLVASPSVPARPAIIASCTSREVTDQVLSSENNAPRVLPGVQFLVETKLKERPKVFNMGDESPNPYKTIVVIIRHFDDEKRSLWILQTVASGNATVAFETPDGAMVDVDVKVILPYRTC